MFDFACLIVVWNALLLLIPEMIRRIALGIEYQGQHFHGWQKQQNLPTIQGAIETALQRIAGETIRIIAAGRTDAGVHATHQVIHFDPSVQRPLTAWVRGTNSYLDENISILWAKEVCSDFHARFSAIRRHYRYFLLQRPCRSGLWSKQIGWTFHSLNLVAMQKACSFLIGTHDFSTFRAAGCQAKTPIKIMYHAHVRQVNAVYVFDFVANAFLLHMVRNLVGSLVEIGKENQPPEWIKTLLQYPDHQLCAPTFSPYGLYFLGPTYDSKWGIPQNGHFAPPFL